MPAPRTHFDESRWPVVIVTPPPTPLDEAGLEAHCKQAFGYFERGQSFAWVFDVRKAAQLTASQRRIIAEATDASRMRHPDLSCAAAVILSSAVQRGVVKAINWMTRQPVPTEVFATVEQGVAWASAYLATASAMPTRRAAP